MLDETVVAKIEQSLGDELPNNAEFGQELRKLTPLLMSLSRQFQNYDSFIFSKGTFNFQQVLRWKMKNNNSDAKKIQSLQHADIQIYPNISTILQLLLTLPVGSCSCERSLSSLRGPAHAWLMRG